MTTAFRVEVLKAAIKDDETRRKLNLALTWKEIEDILVEFAKSNGWKVVQL